MRTDGAIVVNRNFLSAVRNTLIVLVVRQVLARDPIISRRSIAKRLVL